MATETKPIIETYGCAITADIWTEDSYKTSFIFSTIYYTSCTSGSRQTLPALDAGKLKHFCKAAISLLKYYVNKYNVIFS